MSKTPNPKRKPKRVFRHVGKDKHVGSQPLRDDDQITIYNNAGEPCGTMPYGEFKIMQKLQPKEIL